MKILLIFPNTRRRSVFFPSIIQPSLGLGYIAAMIQDAHETQVMDAAAENLKFKQIFTRINKFRPDIIGITTNISTAYISCELALRIKLHSTGNAKIVMGGPWATSNAEYLIRHRVADIVVLGEGEITFKELVDRLARGEPLDDVQGMAFRDRDGAFKQNPKREFLSNLDLLPYPAWELFPPSTKYFNHYRYRPLYPMMITRGCPYHCIHCTKDVHGYKIRKRSVSHVIGEMKYLVEKFKAREIIIVDDNFTFDVPYAESILDAIRKEGLEISIEFPNGIRADTFSPRLMRKMRLAGVHGFSIGVESGVQFIVKKIGKNLDLNKVRYAARLAREHGFTLRAFFMLGLPYDSLQSMRHTARFAKEIDPHFAYFFMTTLFPGTPMFDMVREKGAIDEYMPDPAQESSLQDKDNLVDIGFFYKAVGKFLIGKLQPGDVQKAYITAVREFYMRPAKIIDIVRSIRSIPELAWILHYFFISILNVFTITNKSS